MLPLHLPLYVSAPGLRWPEMACSGEICLMGGERVAERDLPPPPGPAPGVVQWSDPEPLTTRELTGTNAFMGSFCLRTRLDILFLLRCHCHLRFHFHFSTSAADDRFHLLFLHNIHPLCTDRWKKSQHFCTLCCFETNTVQLLVIWNTFSTI